MERVLPNGGVSINDQQAMFGGISINAKGEYCWTYVVIDEIYFHCCQSKYG